MSIRFSLPRLYCCGALLLVLSAADARATGTPYYGADIRVICQDLKVTMDKEWDEFQVEIEVYDMHKAIEAIVKDSPEATPDDIADVEFQVDRSWDRALASAAEHNDAADEFGGRGCSQILDPVEIDDSTSAQDDSSPDVSEAEPVQPEDQPVDEAGEGESSSDDS